MAQTDPQAPAAIPLAYARPLSDEEREAGAAAMILDDTDMSEAAARLRFGALFKSPRVAADFYSEFQQGRFALERARGACAECGEAADWVVRIRWMVRFGPRFMAFSVASATHDVQLRTFHPLCERCAERVTEARRRVLRIIGAGEALALMAIGAVAFCMRARQYTWRETLWVALALALAALATGQWLAQTPGQNPLGPGLRRVVCGRFLGIKRVRRI